jgi:hypothetical protein
MNRIHLKAIVAELENACSRIEIALTDALGDRPAVAALAVAFQRMLDGTQQRLDDLRRDDDDPPETRLAQLICPRCGQHGRLLWHFDAGTCVEQHGEAGWAKAKRLARTPGEPTDQ